MFVGRSREIEQLVAAFKSVAADEGATTVLLGGEAGVGKTRLVSELASLVREAGGVVLAGSCLDLTNPALPFGPVVQALRTLLRSLDATTLDAVIGPAAEVIDRLVPELRVRAPTVESATSSAPFEHLLGVFTRLGHRVPTLLVLEDLHWADHSTRDLLVFLARNLHERCASSWWARTVRTTFTGVTRCARCSPSWIGSGAALHVELARFDREELREMVTSILGREPSPEYARHRVRALGGQRLLRRGADRRSRHRRAPVDVARHHARPHRCALGGGAAAAPDRRGPGRACGPPAGRRARG